MAYEPPNNGDGAQLLVNKGWQTIQSEAGSLMASATQSLNAISNALYNVPTPRITFNPPTVQTGTFVRPVPPAAPVIPAIDTSMPAAPSMPGITLGDIPAAPTAPDFSGMTFAKPAAPNAAMPTAPADTDVALIDINIPDAPEFVMPADPLLYELNLPPIPDLVIPEFQGQRPTATLLPPPHTFTWQYEAYDTGFIDQIKGKLSSMAMDGIALPPHIEQAIFDRLRGREDVLSKQQIEQNANILAGRGLRQPGGLIQKAIARVFAQQRQAASTANRELTIEAARQQIESVKFGLSQGIALESAMLQNHIAIQSLVLDGAKFAQTALIQLFEAQIALHNAEWEGFKAEASVFESRIRALAAQADVLKTRIEAEKVKGDVNEGLVRAFGEKIRALSSLADMYRAQVEGAKAKGEINVQRLEQARLRITTFGVKVDAWAKGWDGYRAQVEAEGLGLRYYETLGNIYGTQIQGFKGQVEAQDTRTRSEIAAQNQQIELFKATIAGVATRIQGETAAGELNVRAFQGLVGMYEAEGQMSAAEVGSINDSQRTVLDGSKLVFETARTNATMAADIAMKRVDQAIEAGKGSAQIWAQLAASIYSGMNFSAGIGYNEGMSWTFSGEI